MGWQDDLASLLGGAKDEIGRNLYESDSLPFNEIAEGNWGGAATAPISGAFNLLDYPLTGMKDLIGYGLAAPDLYRDALGFGDAGTQATIKRLESEGEGGLGGKVNWENFIQDKPWFIKAPLEIGLDPTNWVGVGLLDEPIKGLKAARDVGEITNVGRAMLPGLQATKFVLNDAPGFAFDQTVGRALRSPVGQGAKRAGVGALNKIVPNALDYSPASKARRSFQQIESAIDEKLQSMGMGLPKKYPPVATLPGPGAFKVVPFETYDVPPFFQKGLPGVSGRVQSDAFDAWVRLKQKHMSMPNLPGITTPGMTANPDIPGLTTPGISQNQQLGNMFQNPGVNHGVSGPGPGGLTEAYKKWAARQQKLGINPPPPGGYADPAQVVLDEEDLDDMAKIAAGVMMAYNDEIQGKMFQPLYMASEGAKRGRNAIVEKYGAGIQPYIPAAWRDVNRSLTESGRGAVNPRFSTPVGWPEGEVSTARLDAMNAALAKAKTPEARQAVIDKFTKGNNFKTASPQILETAAGIGSAPMLADQAQLGQREARALFDPFEGVMRPGQTDLETGRTAVHPQFQNFLEGEYRGRFQTNREAYETYMRGIFPNLTQQELDIIRERAIEVSYIHMVNAASQVSSGGNLHTFAKRGPLRQAEAWKTKMVNGKPVRYIQRDTNYKGDPFQKIGVFPEGPSDIGQTYTDIPEGTTSLPFGRISWGSANKEKYLAETGRELDAAEYTRLTGKKKTGNLNEELIQEAMDAAGIPGFQPNPVGGALANTSRIVEMFKAGRDIPVGDTKAAEWYANAAKELEAIVGPNNFEDAEFVISMLAVTSSGTDVEMNALNTLRAYAEYKMGTDDFIRNNLGLSAEEVDTLLRGLDGKWGDDSEGFFRGSMKENQRQIATNIYEHYAMKDNFTPWTPMQGGPKTNNYDFSFVVNLWEDGVKRALPEGPLRDRVLTSLNEAATVFTVDRHQSRIDNLATSVSPMEAITSRERGIIAANKLGLRGEDVQAATWYFAKDRQGFTRVARNDDMAVALREAWNEAKDPANNAYLRNLARENIGPDASEIEIAQFLDSLQMQEVLTGIAYKALKKNEGRVTQMLGRNPLEAILGSNEDVVGIVSRQARGVQSRRNPADAIIDLTGEIPRYLEAIRNGSSYGVTLGWDGNNFVPEDPPAGFAVALTSAGRALETGKGKTGAKKVNEFLLKYADLLDDPATYPHIKFGFFPMDGQNSASFDLTLIVPDEQTAVALAQRANQKAVWDIANAREIATGGDGTPVINRPGEIRDIITDIFGDGSYDNGISRLARSENVQELSGGNVLSILQRRVVNPILERYDDLSSTTARNVERAGQAGNIQTPGGGVLLPSAPNQAAPVDFSAIGQDPFITTQGHQVLSQKLGNSTVGAEFDRIYAEAQEDTRTLVQSGVQWGPAATADERLAAAAGDEAATKIIRKYNKLGIDPMYADPRDIVLHQINRQVQKDHGVKVERESLWDLFVSAWGEQALFSPKYHTGNLLGAYIQNAFSGHMGADGPGAAFAAWKLTRGGLESVEREEALRQLKSFQIAQKWGFDELPSYISRGGVRGMTSETRTSGSAVGELTARVTKSQRLGKAVGRPFEANADLSQAIETVIRGSLWADFLDEDMTKRMLIVEDTINQQAVAQGLTTFEFSMVNGINLPQTGGRVVMTPKVLKDHLVSLGFADGYAERSARNFAEARNQSKAFAKKMVDKYQFSYDRTNLDEFVGKFAPFMYYASRSTRFYAEELLRHPFVALNFWRANKGIEEAQDDPGLSARQKGFFKLMGGPLGFTILMNPEVLIGAVRILGLDDSYDPEGQTELGGAIQWAKQRGMGLYPWIDGTFNMMGMYGNTFEPDLLGIRHKAILGSVVNFMRSHMGMEPADAPYAQAMGQARWGVSAFVSQFTPDWLTQPVTPKAGGNTTDATFDQVIESRIIANNPHLTNGMLLEIMDDETHPEYQRAYQQAADAGVLQQLLNFTFPTKVRVRENSRDIRTAQVSTIWEAAEAAGVDPWKFKPGLGDVEFATRYKALTGKEWSPEDYQTAKDRNDLMRATPEHKMFVLAEQEYNRLGGKQASAIFQRYQDILFGDDPAFSQYDPDSRRELANMWADQNGYADTINSVYQLRDAYEQTHPEFGQFKGWQGQMFMLKTQLGGTLDEYRRQAMKQNPNARTYFAKMISGIKEDYPQDQWAAEIERQTTNMNAYLSITGVPQNRYDPGPSPMTPAGDFTLATQTPAAPATNMPQAVYAILNQGSGFGLDTYGTYWNS
jgi:hypothetical protein